MKKYIKSINFSKLHEKLNGVYEIMETIHKILREVNKKYKYYFPLYQFFKPTNLIYLNKLYTFIL